MLEFEFEFGEFSRHFQNSNSSNIREFEYEFELGEFFPTPACTSVEGTRAPSTGDAIERTIDSARPPWEKSNLGQNRVTLYFTSELLHSSQAL
jgi:hypothetical protein